MKKILSTLALATCLSSNAMAAGFYIQEQSVSGLGNAFAGQTALARDASIVYFNAAGMTYLEGTQGNIGVHILSPRADIDDNGTVTSGLLGGLGEDSDNPYDPTPVPNLHLSHQYNDNLWVGLSVTAPFGLGSEYDEDSYTRYDSIKTELKTINVQPSLAYKVNDKLSIGGGLDIQYADAELTAAAFAGTVGRSTLEGDDISYGYNLGFIYEPTPATKLGVNYRSQINHKLDGKIIAEGTTGADRNDNGKANLNLPDILSVSAAHELNNKWTIMGGATYFGWSNFERITATTDAGEQVQNVLQNYENTMAYNIGAEYKHSDEWTFRGGVQFDETPTVDGFRTTRTPDGDRIWLSGGATYTMNEKMSFDMALTYIDVAKGDINLLRNPTPTPPFPANTNSQINAESSGNVGIIAFGMNYKF